MAKLTVLAIVQDVMNDMKSDSVNSISDTIESQTIAQMVKSTYFDMIEERTWPTSKELMQLTASGTSARPTEMTIPDSIREIYWIKYNKRLISDTIDKFSDVDYLEPTDFIELCNGRDSSLSTITEQVDTISNVTFLVVNDTAPTYWTSFDDETIIFDSYDSDIDSTLQASKTQTWVSKEPSFTVSDSHVPDLPAKSFPLFVNEVKSLAFATLKQVPANVAERRARRQKTTIARTKWRTKGGIKFPNYGR